MMCTFSSKAWLGVILLAAPFLSIHTYAAEQVFVFEQGLNGYEGMEDNSIFEESENSGGGTAGIFAGTTAQIRVRRALLWANLSSIPAGATVTSVTLEMTVDRSGLNSGESPFTIHRLLKDWGEGDVEPSGEGGFGAPAEAGDATWTYNFFNTSEWDTAGGDFTATASATANAGQTGSTATWTSETMAADVQGWIDDPASNFGWLIKSDQEGAAGVVKKFFSSEAADNRPRLTIVVNVPPAPGADINGDSAFDAVDVQLAINAALDIDIGGLDADVDNNGAVDAVDVQLVINAALE